MIGYWAGRQKERKISSWINTLKAKERLFDWLLGRQTEREKDFFMDKYIES